MGVLSTSGGLIGPPAAAVAALAAREAEVELWRLDAPAIMTSARMCAVVPHVPTASGPPGSGSVSSENTRTSLGNTSGSAATKTRCPPKGMMTPRGRGIPAPNREALSMMKSHAPLLITRPKAKRMRDADDAPVRIKTPVDASACPTVGANYRRYVTADSMGMAKEGDKPRLVSLVPESRMGTHSETPRCTQVRGSP